MKPPDDVLCLFVVAILEQSYNNVFPLLDGAVSTGFRYFEEGLEDLLERERGLLFGATEEGPNRILSFLS